jgi:hypothetical protein
MVARVKRAGAPAVPNGARTQALVTAALTRVGDIFHTALRKARALPRSNAFLFASRTTALSRQITAGFREVGEAFAAIDTTSAQSLARAARSTPACAKLA